MECHRALGAAEVHHGGTLRHAEVAQHEGHFDDPLRRAVRAQRPAQRRQPEDQRGHRGLAQEKAQHGVADRDLIRHDRREVIRRMRVAAERIRRLFETFDR
jgi:hypothetical protein